MKRVMRSFLLWIFSLNFTSGYRVPFLDGSQRVPSQYASSGLRMGLSTSSEVTNIKQPKVLCFVEEGAMSPIKDFMTHETPTWEAVMRQVSRRVGWADARNFQMDVITISPSSRSLSSLLSESTILFGIGLTSTVAAETLAKAVESCATPPAIRLIWGSAAPASDLTQLGTFKPSAFSELPPRLSLLRALLSGGTAADRSMWDLAKALCERNSAEDLAFCLLSLISTYITPVLAVQGLTKKTGLSTIGCIVSKCRQQFLGCITDPQCKAALDCLTACPPGDQVCSYRCIVSYETPAFESFSLCTIQRNNCLGNTATAPALPNPPPAAVLSGAPVTFDKADDVLVGWLGVEGLKWSWKVVCGQNPAYDKFPNQHQIFYRTKSTGRLWYDPVFGVITLNGESVWRRRHYMVQRGGTPGTYNFSVSDNGVTSAEYWRIIDVADDMSWAVFYYTGAASAAGQSYTGALLTTKDGHMPTDPSALPRIQEAFATCGIETWELSQCTNTDETDNAPLDIEEKYRLMQRPNPLQKEAPVAA